MNVVQQVSPREQSPEIGKMIMAGGFRTNVHDVGEGDPVLLIHGSGPGVTAWANWRLNMPHLAKINRVIAPDCVGFGYTERAQGAYGQDMWLNHLIAVLDELEVEKVSVVGNSFGCSMALGLAIHHPERVNRIVLMGAVGVDFELTEGLNEVWGYDGTLDHMRKLLDIFAFDRGIVTDDLAKLRYEAASSDGRAEAFAGMFPAPRQRWVKALAHNEADIAAIPHQTLIVHGREDRVIPMSNALRLHELINRSEVHLFGQCGHWTQIEHADRFNMLVEDFLK